MTSEILLVKKPLASKITHNYINPYVYENIQTLTGLEALAELLNTPADWIEKSAFVVDNLMIREQLKYLLDVALEEHERCIQERFGSVVSCIADVLNVDVHCNNHNRIVVGGLLAIHRYDHISRTDSFYSNETETAVYIATEIKTATKFPLDQLWYEDTRAIQVLSAMYAYNAPTFLLSQQQWKLFVENPQRNAVFSFPPENTDFSAAQSATDAIWDTFLRVIVICLLSQRPAIVAEQQSGLSTQVTTLETPAQPAVDQGPSTSQLASSSAVPCQRNREVVPTYVTGYQDGVPIYAAIRIRPPDKVAML